MASSTAAWTAPSSEIWTRPRLPATAAGASPDSNMSSKTVRAMPVLSVPSSTILMSSTRRTGWKARSSMERPVAFRSRASSPTIQLPADPASDSRASPSTPPASSTDSKKSDVGLDAVSTPATYAERP